MRHIRYKFTPRNLKPLLLCCVVNNNNNTVYFILNFYSCKAKMNISAILQTQFPLNRSRLFYINQIAHSNISVYIFKKAVKLNVIIIHVKNCASFRIYMHRSAVKIKCQNTVRHILQYNLNFAFFSFHLFNRFMKSHRHRAKRI